MKLSECCDAKIILTDICSHCKEHSNTKPFGMSEAADYEPTTADEYNDKWMNEQRRRGNVTGDTK